MTEINLQLSDQLAELVRAYGISISEICQQALEREVAAQMGLASLTPRSRRVLEHAMKEARQRGEDFIGTEHLLLGLLEEDGLATQALQSLGIIEAVRARVGELIEASRRSGPSNQVLDSSGNLIGYMIVADDGSNVVVTPDGIPINFEKGEHGESFPVDKSGRRVLLPPAKEMPRLIEFDDAGEQVVLRDASDPRTEE